MADSDIKVSIIIVTAGMHEYLQECIEKCLVGKFAAPRPWYGLVGPGTNCQEWADDALSECRKQCKKK